MIESWTIRIGQHMTKFKKINIGLFLILNATLFSFFIIRLSLAYNIVSKIFEGLVGLLFIIIGACWCWVVTRFLKMLKIRIPFLYRNNRIIILSFSITLSISLFWRGLTMVFVFCYHQFWNTETFRSFVMYFIEVTNYNEFVPAVLLDILLLK